MDKLIEFWAISNTIGAAIALVSTIVIIIWMIVLSIKDNR